MPKLRAPSKAALVSLHAPHSGSVESKARGEANGRPQVVHKGPTHGCKLAQQLPQMRCLAPPGSSSPQSAHSVGKTTARTALSKSRRTETCRVEALGMGDLTGGSWRVTKVHLCLLFPDTQCSGGPKAPLPNASAGLLFRRPHILHKCPLLYVRG